MARAPMPGEAPAPAPTEPAMMDAGAEQPALLFTGYLNPDGTYMLEGSEEFNAEGGDPEAPQGQTFRTIGELLKGVLDIVQGEGQGDEGGVEQMGAGFKGANGAPPEGPV